MALDKLRVEGDGSSRYTRSGEDENAKEGELNSSDVFQDFSCGCPGGELLVHPSAKDGGEDGVEDDVGDVEEGHDGSESADVGVDVLEFGQGGLNVSGEGHITGGPTEAVDGKVKVAGSASMFWTLRFLPPLTRWG